MAIIETAFDPDDNDVENIVMMVSALLLSLMTLIWFGQWSLPSQEGEPPDRFSELMTPVSQ
jgi:hypothetical protein